MKIPFQLFFIQWLLIFCSVSCDFGKKSSSDENEDKASERTETSQEKQDEMVSDPEIELILEGVKNNKLMTNKSEIIFTINFSQIPKRDIEANDFEVTGGRQIVIEKKSDKQYVVKMKFDKSKPKEELTLVFFASRFNDKLKDTEWDLLFDQESPTIKINTNHLITNAFDIKINIESSEDGDLDAQGLFVKNGTLKSLTKSDAGQWICVINPENQNTRTEIKVHVIANQIQDSFENGNLKSNELVIDYNPNANVVRLAVFGNQPTYRQSGNKFYSNANPILVKVIFTKNVPGFLLNQIGISENVTLGNFRKVSDTEYHLEATIANIANVGRIGIQKDTINDEHGFLSNHQDELIELQFVNPPPDIDTPAGDPSVLLARTQILDQAITYAHSHGGIPLGGPGPGDSKLYGIDVPFSPFGGRAAPAATLIFRYITSNAQAFFAAKFPRKLIARLPDTVKNAVRGSVVTDVDLYFVIQDAPGADLGNTAVDHGDVAQLPSVKTHYLLDSWEFNRDLPVRNYDYIQNHLSGIFDTENGFLRDYAPGVRRDFQEDSINIHPESSGNPVTIFSGNSGHIANSRVRTNYAFWSLVVSPKHGRAAVTLHWAIVNRLDPHLLVPPLTTDIDFQNEDLRVGYFNPQCAGAGCSLRGFIGYLNGTFPAGAAPNRPKTRKLIESLSGFLQ